MSIQEVIIKAREERTITKVYKNINQFIKRPNSEKYVNGVSKEHAQKHPDYHEDNSKNIGCWNTVNSTNCKYSANLVDCYDCKQCESCTNCRESFGLTNKQNLTHATGKPARYI